jgi:hypothetical protein
VYTTAGTYNVSLMVTDNESFTATVYRNIVVQPGPPGPPGPPVDLSSVWPFTLLAVVVLGAILLVWWARRRRRPEQPPPPPM